MWHENANPNSSQFHKTLQECSFEFVGFGVQPWCRKGRPHWRKIHAPSPKPRSPRVSRLHLPNDATLSLKSLEESEKTNAMFIMVYSLQELEKPWIRSNMLHDLHAMYVLLKMLKAPDHRDRAQENSDLWDVETGGKERLAASHSHIEPCKDVLWSCQNRSIAKERWVSGKMAPSLRV